MNGYDFTLITGVENGNAHDVLEYTMNQSDGAKN